MKNHFKKSNSAHVDNNHDSMKTNFNLLGLVNVWLFGSLALLADDWNTIRISLSDLISLSLSLVYE